MALDARRVVDPARERPAGRPPGAVPGRAARAAHPALHVTPTTSCSTRSWAAARRSSPPPGSAGGTSATTSIPSYVEIARHRVASEGRRAVGRRSTPAPSQATTAKPAEAALVDAGLHDRRPATGGSDGTGVTVDLVADGRRGRAVVLRRGRAGDTTARWVWPAPTRSGGRSAGPRPPRATCPARSWCSPRSCRPHGSDGDLALRAAVPTCVFDVIDLLADDARRAPRDLWRRRPSRRARRRSSGPRKPRPTTHRQSIFWRERVPGPRRAKRFGLGQGSGGAESAELGDVAGRTARSSSPSPRAPCGRGRGSSTGGSCVPSTRR